MVQVTQQSPNEVYEISLIYILLLHFLSHLIYDLCELCHCLARGRSINSGSRTLRCCCLVLVLEGPLDYHFKVWHWGIGSCNTSRPGFERNGRSAFHSCLCRSRNLTSTNRRWLAGGSWGVLWSWSHSFLLVSSKLTSSFKIALMLSSVRAWIWSVYGSYGLLWDWCQKDTDPFYHQS